LSSIDEDLRILDHKLGQLRLAYDQYFLGARPREPLLLRQEVQKLVVTYANQAIPNTGLRFKFSSLCARYQAFKRQWEETLRKIEEGSYSRHRFKARLHEEQRGGAGDEAAPAQAQVPGTAPAASLFEAWVQARRSCGQGVESLSPERFQEQLRQQEAALRERFGGGAFRFRVVVEDGRAKLKAARLPGAG
jgi:hypothetical protein